MGQLNNSTTYLKLMGNPTRKYKEELESLIDRVIKKKILNEKEAKYLVPNSCGVPVIYTIPKLHKDQVHPPGRPIVNGIQSVNACLGKYINQFFAAIGTKDPFIHTLETLSISYRS